MVIGGGDDHCWGVVGVVFGVGIGVGLDADDGDWEQAASVKTARNDAARVSLQAMWPPLGHRGAAG